jgi:hypothetical protein
MVLQTLREHCTLEHPQHTKRNVTRGFLLGTSPLETPFSPKALLRVIKFLPFFSSPLFPFLSDFILLIFPKGKELDMLARMTLWRVGLDYQHGTGHGVGSFLNVHEGNFYF